MLDFAQKGRRGNHSRLSGYPQCCNEPQVCPYVGPLCPFIAFKARRDDHWAALPRCVVCGGCEGVVRHISVHPEYHPFAAPEVTDAWTCCGVTYKGGTESVMPGGWPLTTPRSSRTANFPLAGACWCRQAVACAGWFRRR